jgi:hypothetical protein
MSAATDYLEAALLNHVLRNVAYTSPTTVYVGLFTAAPGETGGGTEVSGNGYARQAVTFGAPSGGTCENSAQVTFPAASGGNWGTITHFALFDASTAGNMLIYGALTASKVINDGDVFTFPVGNLDISLA